MREENKILNFVWTEVEFHDMCLEGILGCVTHPKLYYILKVVGTSRINGS
jgi:hypothetical protein